MTNIFSSSHFIGQYPILTPYSANDGMDKLNGGWNETEISQKPLSEAEKNINDLFEAIGIELAKLDLQNVVVETTLDDSILVKSDLHEMRFYLELFLLEEETPFDYDIVINLYKNKNHIFGTAGSAKNVFEKLNQFLM